MVRRDYYLIALVRILSREADRPGKKRSLDRSTYSESKLICASIKYGTNRFS